MIAFMGMRIIMAHLKIRLFTWLARFRIIASHSRGVRLLLPHQYSAPLFRQRLMLPGAIMANGLPSLGGNRGLTPDAACAAGGA